MRFDVLFDPFFVFVVVVVVVLRNGVEIINFATCFIIRRYVLCNCYQRADMNCLLYDNRLGVVHMPTVVIIA